MIKKINKIQCFLFIIILLCVIILIIFRTYADGNLNTRTVRYALGSTVNYSFNFFTDCIKFHTKASGYDKYKGMDTENNMNSIIGTDTAKMQGYGNYEFKADTNLFSFIEYCYSKEPTLVEACAYRAGTTADNEWNYTALMSYSDRQVNTSFFKYFWQNMCINCPSFKDYQDDYFFLKYTYPATQKIGINLAKIRNVINDGGSAEEYLTCLTSYIFSITPQAQVNGMTFGKGDVVPFLYFKDRKHANIDVRYDSDGLKEIAKYAYVALIEGWCKLPTPYHLWEEEYQYLYGTYNINDLDYDLETLHEWYDETYQRYCKDKGRKGNNLLGSTIEHIIESDYSIEQQLEATEYYIRGIFSDLGIETDFKETMARNELMAKYMMEHSSFADTIKDYNVTIKFMTENLQRGTHEEQNTHTIVTSDFQTLEFPYTMDKRNVNHSDEDGISDGQELGNEKWINITAFVKRTYEEAVRNGDPHKATFEAQVEDIIEKNGAYIDFGGNRVYGSVKWDDMKLKVLYRVYDYKSNPKLNDTDFDGLWDNVDSKPIDNKFKGTSTEIGKVEYNQDFRWFMTTNQKYNDELAVMSVIMSNLADGNTVSTDQASGNINTYLSSIGFSNIQNIGENGDKIYIANKTIDYYGNKKDVIGVFLGKCDRWYNDVIKYKESQKVQYINATYRESLETYIIRMINKINLLSGSNECCYWVSGYDVGGSIASELSAKLLDTGKEVYAYTFGAMNTRDNQDTKNEIKNLRNEDDFFVKYITGNKPGQNYGASIFEDLMWEYRDLTKSLDYKGNYIFTNYLLYVYDETEFLNINSESDANRILANYFRTFNKITNQNDIENYADLVMLLNEWRDGNEQAHSIKSYYALAKLLNGFNILDGNGEKQEHYKNIPVAMVFAFNHTEEELQEESEYGNVELLDIIDAVAEFYINNIPTYQKSLKTTNYYFYETKPARDNIKAYLATKSMIEIPVSKRSASEFYKEMDEEVSDKKIIVHYRTGTNKYSNALGFRNRISERFITSLVPQIHTNEFESSGENIFSFNGLYWYKWRDYFEEKASPYISPHQQGTGFDIGVNISENEISEHAKDDCSGFAKLVLDMFIKSKSNYYSALPKDLTSQSLLGTSNSNAMKLMNAGFEVYKVSSNDNVWKRYKNGVEQQHTYNIKTKDLAPGDMLVCDNCGTKQEYKINDDKSNYTVVYKNQNPLHVEFYIGYNYNTVYNNEIFEPTQGFTYQNYEIENVKKKSGIQSLIRNDINDNTYKKAEGTFSWGNIADEYPLQSSSGQNNYFYKRDNEAFFRHCECGEEPEAQVAICRDTTTNKVGAYYPEQLSAENALYLAGLTTVPKLIPLTEYFPSHKLASKNCYFNERQYDTLWRYTK